MKERYRGSTEYEIQKQLAEFAVYKGVCVIANAVLALVFCIICGKVALGIITGVVLTLLAFYFYILQSNPIELTYGKLMFRDATNPVMIASWPISLAVTLLAAGTSGKLASLWVWITVAYVITLFMQMIMWPQTRKRAEEAVSMQDDVDAMERLFEMVKDGQMKCASCGERIRGMCAIACKDGKGAALCDNCLPGKEGEWTEIQGMHFIHVNSNKSSGLFGS